MNRKGNIYDIYLYNEEHIRNNSNKCYISSYMDRHNNTCL